MLLTDTVYPWHIDWWRQLNRCYALGQLPHALLLTGPAGLGKRFFAHRLIQRLLCTSPSSSRGESDAFTPCARCTGCRLLQQGGHPDWHTLAVGPDEKHIKIDAVRGAIQSLHRTPQQNHWRIVLIESADTLTTQASNALLKGLEEPGKYTVLILISHRPHHVLPTIRSRCQTVPFRAPSPEAAHAWLASAAPKTTDVALLQGVLALHDRAPLSALDALTHDHLGFFKQLLVGVVKVDEGVESPSSLVNLCLTREQGVPLALFYLFKIGQGMIAFHYHVPSLFDAFPLKSAFRRRLDQLIKRRSVAHWRCFLEKVMTMQAQIQQHTSVDQTLQLAGLLAGLSAGLKLSKDAPT